VVNFRGEDDAPAREALIASIIRDLVPGTPRDLAARIDEPLRSVLDHTQIEFVRLLCHVQFPHLTAHSVDSCSTLGELDRMMAQGPRVRNYKRLESERYEGPRVRLRPLGDADVGALYHASIEPTVAHRWRFRGATPSPELFSRVLFEGVLTQFVVAPLNSSEPLGLVSAYEADTGSGHCRLAIQRTAVRSEHPQNLRGAVVEGAMRFIDYLFDHWTFRKIYIELPEYNLPLFRLTSTALFEEEGRLKEHFFHKDRWWDLRTYAIYRDRWRAAMAPFREALPNQQAASGGMTRSGPA
jgi:hypothetical protein